jgi:hypothetical protein
MSRGPGSVQRQVLAILREHARNAPTLAASARGLSTRTLAALVYYPRPDWPWIAPAERIAVSRALHALARRGLVLRFGRMDRSRQCYWHVGRWACQQAKADRAPRPRDAARTDRDQPMHMNNVGAALKLLTSRSQDASAEAIATYLRAPNVYTLDRVTFYLDRLKRDGHYDRIVHEGEEMRRHQREAR